MRMARLEIAAPQREPLRLRPSCSGSWDRPYQSHGTSRPFSPYAVAGAGAAMSGVRSPASEAQELASFVLFRGSVSAGEST